MRMPYNGEKRRLRRENPGAERAAGAKEDAEMAIMHASIFSQALKRTVPIEVILPADKEIPGLNDSKKLSEKKREALFPLIV